MLGNYRSGYAILRRLERLAIPGGGGGARATYYSPMSTLDDSNAMLEGYGRGMGCIPRLLYNCCMLNSRSQVATSGITKYGAVLPQSGLALKAQAQVQAQAEAEAETEAEAGAGWQNQHQAR
ncbi:hypothetical protein K431DRAFT_295174 [Polychaeton citri CBS 116435]|uniref:Uncharacterized protein n=1 Tax=Polychaeton citri CBS 116435 TaxID=1314669 RepID=A0A9P4Q4L7_9PEZI|nr:hypothetical protein K431DRAFT_295174 [Polychaeton citri CBS 116435]